MWVNFDYSSLIQYKMLYSRELRTIFESLQFFPFIQYKIFYMLIALLWWVIPMSICVGYTISSIVKLKIDIKTNTKYNDTLAVTILTCGFITFYILAALSFAAMWRNARQYNA